MIKVLHIGPKNFPPSHGGVEKSVYDLVRNLSGVRSYIAVELEHPPASALLQLPKGLLRQVRAIQDFSAQHSIDILHFNKEGFIPHALIFHLFLRRRVVLTVRGCAWRLAKWPLHIRAAFYGLDVVASVLLPNVVFVGRRDYEHFKRITPFRELRFFPNGVANHDSRARGGPGRFVYVGRISAEKNVLRMIQWFRGCDATLDIFGPIDERSEAYGSAVLRAVADLPNVDYKGVLKHDQLFQTLADYGGFINCSFSEGMPVSVLEAASVGLSLVLSDIPQHRHLGFPDVKYVSPTAECVLGIEEFGGYSSGNAVCAVSEYSLMTTCQRYERLYQNVVAADD